MSAQQPGAVALDAESPVGGFRGLPSLTSELVPREREVATVVGSFGRSGARLVTLVGAPGAGKTCLALVAARQLLPSLAQGACFVDLAPIRDPSLVLVAIAQGLGVSDTGDRPLAQSLKGVIADRAILLVLDNFEHVLAAGPVVSELLRDCPELKVLVTSRAALHVSGEHQVVVPPLDLPEPHAEQPLELLARVPSVALFCLRAQAVNADWSLSASNASAVAQLCVRLDGLPLAIELAAAWMRVLSPQAMLPRLEHALQVLVSGDRDQPARHQTLRAAIAWSYELLDPAEQSAFRRLAVFVGGWTVQAASRVCGLAESEMLNVTARLVDKNLVIVKESPEADARFGMLETLRAFALEELVTRDEAASAEQRHAEVFTEFAERAERELEGPDQLGWLLRVEQEYDNLRVALERICANHKSEIEADLGLRIAAGLWFFWDQRGHLREGREWLSRLLQLPGPPPASLARAMALNAAGWLALVHGDYESSAALQEESLTIADQLASMRARARALVFLALALALGQREYERVTALLHEGLAIARELEDEWCAGLALYGLGHTAGISGDAALAARYWQECLELSRRVGNLWAVSFLQFRWGLAAFAAGRLDDAAALLKQSLELGLLLGNARTMAVAMESLALLSVAQQQPERAACLFGAADALLQFAGYNLPHYSLSEHERCVALARARIGTEAFTAAWDRGRQMPRDQAIAFALATPGATISSNAGARVLLSEREHEVALRLAMGMTNRQIATELGIGERTVGTHTEHIFKKLGVRTRAQVAAWVVGQGLLDRPGPPTVLEPGIRRDGENAS